jgi:U6 snRNA-associated Sm-like protein LSm2
MLFYSFFKTLVGKEVTVELKNDLAITGTLHSVDQFLNVKLSNTRVADLGTPAGAAAAAAAAAAGAGAAPPQTSEAAAAAAGRHPHMASVRNCFVRGSVVRYVQLPPGSVDVEILHDATRREARGAA